MSTTKDILQMKCMRSCVCHSLGSIIIICWHDCHFDAPIQFLISVVHIKSSSYDLNLSRYFVLQKALTFGAQIPTYTGAPPLINPGSAAVNIRVKNTIAS